ncbi:MAG: ATP-binding protein, partial [Spirulina sp.]
PEAQKQTTHVKIGQLLLHNTPESQQDENIFVIVNQLNYGTDLLATRDERDRLARLNFKAGRKALASTAYGAAVAYLNLGRELLESDAWQHQYALCLALHESAAEATYLAGDFAAMEQRVESVLQHARSVLDRIKVYEIRMQAYASRNQFGEALQVALQGLQALDFDFPNPPTPPAMEAAFAEVAARLQDRSIAELADLPLMENKTARAIVRLLARSGSPAFQGAPHFFPLIALKMVGVSLEYGNAAESSLGYGLYGILLTIVFDDWDGGYQFGEVALKLLERFDDRPIECQTKFIVNCSLKYVKDHLRNVIQPAFEAYQIGLENGEIEFAGYNILHHCDHCFFTGYPLPDLEQKLSVHIATLEQLQETTSSNILRMYGQAVVHLLQGTAAPGDLIGDVYNEVRDVPRLQGAQNRKGLFTLYFIKLILGYLGRDFAKAIATGEILEQYLEISRATFTFPIFLFYDSLAHLMGYPEIEAGKREQLLERVNLNQKQLQQWATRSPANWSHKWHLVEAERHRLFGHSLEALEAYDRAIAGAKANAYIQDESLASELAAQFYLDWGKETVARGYMQEAYYNYARWGAKAKIDDLEQRYPHLLEPILQQKRTIPDSLAALTQMSAPQRSPIAPSNNSSSSSSSSNIALDFAALLEAAQSLSRTIQLEDLLRQLVQIILQNSGSDRCALILPDREGTWRANATANLETTELGSTPLEGNPHLPVKLIQYVKNTREIVAIDNLETELPIVDADLTRHAPQSLLCLPIFNQGNAIGILYASTQSTRGIFTRDRILVLNFLCTQAAISLENARLYRELEDYSETLEQKVEERTADLTAARERIIAQEKLASLGTLTAGIAHELRNPLNFVKNFAEGSVELARDLFEALQPRLSSFPPGINAFIQSLVTDLQENATTIRDHSHRAAQIIDSMMQHTQTDYQQTSPQSVSVKPLLEQAVKLVYHSQQARDEGFDLSIHTDYATDLAAIEGIPSNLMRAFINLLDNACDAMREKQKQCQDYTPTLEIAARPVEEGVEIRIGDNGCGIEPEIRHKILDPFFTTKPPGEGTGLGLSLTHDIIVQQHRGRLNIDTQPGEFTEIVLRLPLNLE